MSRFQLRFEQPIDFVVLAMRAFGLFPLYLALLMLALTPNYFRPMVRTSLGLWLLVSAGVLLVVQQAITELVSRLLRTGDRGKLAAGVILYSVSLLFCVLPSLWLLLLGPAVVVIATPRV